MNKGEARSAVMEAISVTLKGSIQQQGFASICKELADLEKENAELKKDNEGYEKDNTRLVNQFNQTSAKLIKAKELLKWWVSHCGNHDLHYAKKTEQFLNREVGK